MGCRRDIRRRYKGQQGIVHGWRPMAQVAAAHFHFHFFFAPFSVLSGDDEHRRDLDDSVEYKV